MTITAHQYAQQLYTRPIGCQECAWGKVLGCWRCGSRASVAAVVAPQTYEPHCLMAWEQMVRGADDASDYAVKHQEQVK